MASIKVINATSGQTLEFDEDPVGNVGAEGTVHRLVSNRKVCGKLFHNVLEDDHRERIEHQIANPLVATDTGYEFASPLSMLLEPRSGECVGFLLNFVPDAIDISDLFWATAVLPKRFVVRVAHNLTKSLQQIHAAGMYRRDVPNAFGSRDGSITEFDLDSLGVGTKYINETGKPFYLPPEILQHDPSEWSQIPCTTEQDVFSHAIVLWKLLRRSGDQHPFDVHYTGVGKPLDRTERILQGWFPYEGTHASYEPPRNARPFHELDSALRHLFVQTFVDGHGTPARRPSLDRWLDVLSGLDDDSDVTLTPRFWECLSEGRVPAGNPLPRAWIGRRALGGCAAAATVPLLLVSSWTLNPETTLREIETRPVEQTITKPEMDEQAQVRKPTGRSPVGEMIGQLSSFSASKDGERPQIWEYVRKTSSSKR